VQTCTELAHKDIIKYNIFMEMKEYEFYVTLKDGKGFKVVQKGRTASEAKSAVEAQYSDAKTVILTKGF